MREPPVVAQAVRQCERSRASRGLTSCKGLRHAPHGIGNVAGIGERDACGLCLPNLIITGTACKRAGFGVGKSGTYAGSEQTGFGARVVVEIVGIRIGGEGDLRRRAGKRQPIVTHAVAHVEHGSEPGSGVIAVLCDSQTHARVVRGCAGNPRVR